MGLDLTHTIQPDILAAAFENQPDELFEVLSYLVHNAADNDAARVDWTLLFVEQFVPAATATAGGRKLVSNVASLLEQMSIALKAAVNAAEAKLTVAR